MVQSTASARNLTLAYACSNSSMVHLEHTGQSWMHLVRINGCSVHPSAYCSYVRFSIRRIWFALGIFFTKLLRTILLQANGLCRTSEKTLPQSTVAASSLGNAKKVDLQDPSQSRGELASVDSLDTDNQMSYIISTRQRLWATLTAGIRPSKAHLSDKRQTRICRLNRVAAVTWHLHAPAPT